MLDSRRARRKRSKTLVLMLLPVLLFIGVIGWCIYALDGQKPKRRNKTRRDPAQKDGVTMVPIFFEEQQQIRMYHATGKR